MSLICIVLIGQSWAWRGLGCGAIWLCSVLLLLPSYDLRRCWLRSVSEFARFRLGDFGGSQLGPSVVFVVGGFGICFSLF